MQTILHVNDKTIMKTIIAWQILVTLNKCSSHSQPCTHLPSLSDELKKSNTK